LAATAPPSIADEHHDLTATCGRTSERLAQEIQFDDVTLGQAQGASGQERGAGVGELLHPRGEVGCLADGRVVHAQVAAEMARTTTSPELRPMRI
jgi:hypothetical protein